MGKKKKKSTTNAINTNTNSAISNNSNNKSPPQTSLSSALTKEVFILLSLSGYFNATEYSAFLDDIESQGAAGSTTSTSTTGNYHSDDEMDEIILAMDVYDQERHVFASSLYSLATSLLELIIGDDKTTSTTSIGDDEEGGVTRKDSLPRKNINNIEPILLQSFEESCYQLRNQIQMYKQSLRKQKQYVKTIQSNFLHIIHQIMNQQDYFSSSSSSSKLNIRKMQFLNQFKSKFIQLLNQFKHQLQWEKIMLIKLEDVLLSNGSFYNHWFCGSSSNNNHHHDYDDGDDDKIKMNDKNNNGDTQSSTITLCKDMLQWSKTIDKCLLLLSNRNKSKCIDDVKESLISFVLQTMNDNNNDDDERVTTTNQSQYLKSLNTTKMEEDRQVEDKNTTTTRLLKIDHGITTTANNNDNDDDGSSCEKNEQSHILKRRDILSLSTIEETMNIFFDQTIFQFISSQQHLNKYKQQQQQQQQSESDRGDGLISISNQKGPEHYQNNEMDKSPEQKWQTIQMEKGPMFVLLVGPSNSGKTHFCSMLQNELGHHHHHHLPVVKVLRPKLPSDFLGPTIGSFEDSLLSLFTYATQIAKSGSKCILILDDIEHILGQSFSEDGGGSGSSKSNSNSNNTMNKTTKSNESHTMIRIRGTFLGLMKELKLNIDQSASMNNLLVLCTARSKGDECYKHCFDKMFYLLDPDWDERRHIIIESLGLSSILDSTYNDETDHDTMNRILSTIATSSMGKSRGEIALYCREALNANIQSNDPSINDLEERKLCMERLESVLSSMQTITPDSLKQLSIDESIEMKVLSSKELQLNLKLDEIGNVIFPLLGRNALEAWKQLQSTIITPLCQTDKLNELLYGNTKGKSDDILSKKSITSGILITGAPGVGKTAIAYHCAAYASILEPTLRLLDVSCTSLVSKEVGGSERNISKLFRIARASTPCIVLLDGIENIGQVRGNDNTTEGTMDRLLSTLLIEMDGVTSSSDSPMSNNNGSSSSTKGIAIIGMTHNPPSWIDPALRRPGRLEKNLKLEAPDRKARIDIIEEEMKDIEIDFSGAGYFDPKDKSQLWEHIAMKTDGKSAAEIIAIGKNARIAALRRAIYGSEETVLSFNDFT